MVTLDLTDLFQDAVLTGHFLLSSGLHSDQYVQCAQVLQYPHQAEALGRLLADKLQGLAPDTVVGPALGGVIAAHEVARALGVRCLFAERNAQGQLALRRGFSLDSGERVVVVEDVVTTAKSALETARLVQEAGGEVVGFGSLVARGQQHPLPHLASLWQVNPSHYHPEDCPMCREGIPVVKPGSRNR